MRNYAIYYPKPTHSQIVNVEKFEDLIPTGLSLSLLGTWTRKQLVNQLKKLGILDSGADVTYKVKTADTNTSIYVWKDVVVNMPWNTPEVTRFNFDQPANNYGANNKDIPYGNPGGNTVTTSPYHGPNSPGLGSPFTPWQQPAMLCVLLLENRVSAGPIPNANGPVFTTQQLLQGATGNGNPGLPNDGMTPVSYPNTVQQAANVKAGNFAANANTIPGNVESNNEPRLVPGYSKPPGFYGPIQNPNPNTPNINNKDED